MDYETLAPGPYTLGYITLAKISKMKKALSCTGPKGSACGWRLPYCICRSRTFHYHWKFCAVALVDILRERSVSFPALQLTHHLFQVTYKSASLYLWADCCAVCPQGSERLLTYRLTVCTARQAPRRGFKVSCGLGRKTLLHFLLVTQLWYKWLNLAFPEGGHTDSIPI